MELGKVEFSEGTYIGTIENGKADGFGAMVYHNGDMYVGEWVNNCQTGYGAKRTANFRSMGYFTNGKRNGKFCSVESAQGYNSSKNIYIGNYRNDRKSGQGVLVNPLGEAYVCNFENDLPNGHGYLSHFPTINDGYFAEGNFVNGNLSGQYTSYARTGFSNGETFYGKTIPHLNYYTGYGEWLSSNATPERWIGYHNLLKGDVPSNNFNGVKIFNHGGYENVRSMEEGNWGTERYSKRGVFSKIFKNYDMYIGEWSFNEISGTGIYCYEEFSYGMKAPNLHIRIKDGTQTVRINSTSYKTLEVKFKGVGEGYELWNDGTYIVYKFSPLSAKSEKHQSQIELPVYQGVLNNGAGGGSYSVSASFSGPSSVSRSSVNNGAPTYSAQNSTSSNAQNKSTQSQSAPEEELPNFSGSYRHIGFFERVKLEIENWKEVRDSKKPQPVQRNIKTGPNENIIKLNEEYEFDGKLGARGELKKVKVKKEIHDIPPTVWWVDAGVFTGDEVVKKIKFNCGGNVSFSGNGAFKNCKNLEIVDFSKTAIKEFHEEMFKGCSNLKQIKVPESGVEVINENAFDGCDKLKIKYKGDKREFTVEEFLLLNLVHDRLVAFKEEIAERNRKVEQEKREKQAEENRLKNEKIDGDIKSWANYGFEVNNNDRVVTLTKVTKKEENLVIPTGITHIENGAFDLIKNTVKNIELPETLCFLEEGLFEDCVLLETVKCEKGFVIPNRCFKNCKNLKHAFFKGNAGIIRASAFENCVNLEGFSTSGVSTIEENAFKNCKKLIDVYAPNLDSLGKGAFVGCDSLKKVTTRISCIIKSGCFSSNNKIEESKDGNIKRIYLYRIPTAEETLEKRTQEKLQYADRVDAIVEVRNGKGCLVGYKTNKDAITIPVGVNHIDDSAVKQLKNSVVEITFYEEKTTHGELELKDGQFEGFSALKKINRAFSGSISAKCFKDCANLNTVNFPIKGSLSASAFENCKKLNNIDLGFYCSKISESAFKGCDILHEVIAVNAEKIEKDAFVGCDNLSKVQVSKKCKIDKSAFSKDFKIKVKKKKITHSKQELVISEITLIYKGKKGKKVKGENQNLPYSINTLTNGEKIIYVLDNPPKKLEIVLPAGEVVYFNGVIGSIKDKIKELTIVGAHIKKSEQISYGNYAGVFKDWANLQKIDLSKCTFEEERISEATFLGCKNLKEVILPAQGIKTISQEAFRDCNSLTSIFAPSVEVVESCAFWNDINLKTANFPQAKNIKTNAFSSCYNLQTLTVKQSCYIEGRFAGNTKVIYNQPNLTK